MELYEKDIFEILGINTREDSYTNLIKYLFDNWMEFRNKFIEKFAKNSKNKFELVTRNTYEINDEDRKKIIPDMTLYSDNEIIIIENKIFSGEGYNQTIEYETNKNIIAEYHRIKNPKYSFYYITLNGDRAKNEKFVPMKWSELIRYCCCDLKQIKNNNRIYILVQDLISRCNEYETMRLPNEDESIEEYLSQQRRFIQKDSLFKTYVTNLLEDTIKKYEFIAIFGNANNRNGDILLRYMFRDNWEGTDLEECTDKDDCKFIHIELSMANNTSYIQLCIHYEIAGYKPKKEWEKLVEQNAVNKKVYERYKQERKEFKNKIYNILNWTRIGRNNTIVQKTISKDTKFDELKKWVEKNIDEAYIAIEKCIS